MPSLKNLSIRHKLLVPILIFVTFIFIFAQGFHFFVNYQNEQKNLIDRVSILAKGVAFNLQAAVLFDDSLAAGEVLSAFNADPAILRVKLFDLNEQLFSIYEAQADEAPIPDQTQRDALQKK
ncbi:CHASE sensor domain-containing protein, partial [Vibrio parahaemolyticus]|nr:CHASE sensor domain-containing protein [Vibrio parahaemolyticus]